MRLLLVEDDQTLNRALVAQLGEAGYKVDSALDGREGLYLAKEYAIDLAIVDLGLPGVAGLDLIRTLRADGKEYPILVLTARDRWQDKVAALKLGADDYVVKPFHVEELSLGSMRCCAAQAVGRSRSSSAGRLRSIRAARS